MSRKLDFDLDAHRRMYEEIYWHKKAINRMEDGNIQERKARRKRDKRLSDIEEFLGDL